MTRHSAIMLPPGQATGAEERGSVFFVGNATTVIRHRGFTLLTDPNFLHAGDHAHLGYGITSERLLDPAIEIDQLPAVDLCILSHMHGDHWDEVAAENLRKDLPIVTTGHAAGELAEQGFHETYPLDTWEKVTARRGDDWLRITSMPGRHGPEVVNLALPEVMGSMLEWGRGAREPDFRLYISGDTLVYEDIEAIPERFPNVDLALLHLGGTKIMNVLLTMDAEQGVQMIHIIQPDHVIPIHYNDYTVFESPIEDFLQAADEAGLKSKIHFLKHGETFTIPAAMVEKG